MYKKTFYLLIFLLCSSFALSSCNLARLLETRPDTTTQTGQAAATTVASTSKTSPATSASETVTAATEEPLFDFYTIPANWPRVVPIMSEFQVTYYEWTEDTMHAKGYAKLELIRAINYYTNALKKHVSSSIWEQDPDKPSNTEGEKIAFNYAGEGNKLTIELEEQADGYVFFELIYAKAEPAPATTSTSQPTQPTGIVVDLPNFLIGSWMQTSESKTAPRPVLIIFFDGTLDSNTATPGPLDNPNTWLGGSWQLGEPLEGEWESQGDVLTVSFPEAVDSSWSSTVLALDEDNIQLEIDGEIVTYLRLPVS